MAFAGPQSNWVPGSGGQSAFTEISGLTLSAYVGAPTPGATDTGVLSTAAVTPVNNNPIPATFGKGQGNWTQADVNNVIVDVSDLTTPGSPSPYVHLVSKALVGSDLSIVIHNDGTVASTGMLIDLSYAP